MSGAPVVVVDGTAVDGTQPASPSDWLKTLPQLGAYTTGRTRGGGAKVAQWSSHVARLRSSLATLTATTFESGGEVAALIEPSVRRVLAVCVERNVAGPPDEGTPQCGIIIVRSLGSRRVPKSSLAGPPRPRPEFQAPTAES